MANTAGRMKKRSRSRGETLVETIVAFALLMILLSLVTTVVRAGIEINNRSVANMRLLNDDCAEIEMGVGLTEAGSCTLTLTAAGGSAPLSIPVDVRQGNGGILWCFQTGTVIGG